MNFLSDPQQLFATLLALVLGLTLHEFMHAYTSSKLGDDTAEGEGRLTLNPAAHIDPFYTLILPLGLILIGSPIVFAAAKPVPFNPWALRGGRKGAALVSVAGPLTNFVIAIVAAILYAILPYSPYGATLLGTIIITNVALGVFNLIPFPPLDGSRVLYAFVSARGREMMDRIERTGFAGLILLLLVLTIPPFNAIVPTIVLTIVNILVPGQPAI